MSCAVWCAVGCFIWRVVSDTLISSVVPSAVSLASSNTHESPAGRLLASISAMVRSGPNAASHRSTIHVGWECSNARRSASVRLAADAPDDVLEAMRCAEFVAGNFCVAGGAAKNGVYQRALPSACWRLGQLHRFVHNGVRRHAFEISQLVKTETQGEKHFQINSRERPVEMALQQKIEQRLPAQDAKRDFGRQPGVGARTSAVPCAYTAIPTRRRLGATSRNTSNAIFLAGETGIRSVSVAGPSGQKAMRRHGEVILRIARRAQARAVDELAARNACALRFAPSRSPGRAMTATARKVPTFTASVPGSKCGVVAALGREPLLPPAGPRCGTAARETCVSSGPRREAANAVVDFAAP